MQSLSRSTNQNESKGYWTLCCGSLVDSMTGSLAGSWSCSFRVVYVDCQLQLDSSAKEWEGSERRDAFVRGICFFTLRLLNCASLNVDKGLDIFEECSVEKYCI